jgi:enamine deaminase RidA (YjgF/YER057c/UK114 family)
MDFDDRIDELFLDLPEPPPEFGGIANAVQMGKTVFISGVFPWKNGKMAYKGRLGLELRSDNGKLAAHAACMNALGMLRAFLDGSLNKIKRIVQLRGFVASGAEFHDQDKVLDGASQLITDIFGQTAGKHARTAIGVTALPNNAAIQLELIVELK